MAKKKTTLTANLNMSHSMWTATTTTNTNTAFYPNINNQYVYNTIGVEPIPFHINFSWDGKSVDVSLKNGNDIFKLANAFMEWLDKNEIEYNVKTKGKRKKK